jgi:hypothetical protein
VRIFPPSQPNSVFTVTGLTLPDSKSEVRDVHPAT